MQATTYNQLTLLIMNHGYNQIVSPFNTFQARFKESGGVGLSSTLKVYKIFTKVGQGPWLRGDCLGPTCVINCTPLSVCIVLLSEFVSQNMWLQQDCFQTGKEVCQSCMLLPCLFNLYAEYIMWNSGWINHKLESTLLGEISISSDMQMNPSLWQKTRRK